MPSTAVILNHILPADALDLGRLILNVKDPAQDFYQAKSIPRDISTQRLEKFTEVLSHVKGSRLHGFLTAVFSATFESQKDSSARVESSTCITRQLQNSSDYFLKLCRLKSARDWLESATKRNRSVFLVVGIKTLTDSTVALKEGQFWEATVDAKVPVAAAAAAARVVLPVGDILDPGVRQSRTRRLDAEMGFVAPGEQIYAVQYRKVEFSTFSSRKVDKSWLESGNRWKVYVGLRGSQEDSENDGVEANLSNFWHEQLEGENCETLKVEGEEIMYFW